jgi:hypothetical protein
MRNTGKTRRPKSTDSRRKAGSGDLSEKKALEALGLELYSVIRRSLTRFGIPTSHQKLLVERALRPNKKVPTVSASVLDKYLRLSDLVAAWQLTPGYIDPDGNPRVLNIRGPGPTFEKLTRQFLPAMPLDNAVALACTVANVGTLSGDKVAIYGDMMINTAKTTDSCLAQAIQQIARLLDTCIYNANQPFKGRGRMERTVVRVIPVSDFGEFQEELRPQIQDLCERVERTLALRASRATTSRQKPCEAGMGIFLFCNSNTKRDPKLATSPDRYSYVDSKGLTA